MKKTNLIQLGSNLPNCPKCKSGNALIDHFIQGETIWTCRDCKFEVNNEDVGRIFYPEFDEKSRRYFWKENGMIVDCGTPENPHFEKIFEAIADAEKTEAEKNEAAKEFDPVEMGFDPDKIGTVEKIEILIFLKSGVKVAEIDVGGWTIPEICELIRIQRNLGRSAKYHKKLLTKI